MKLKLSSQTPGPEPKAEARAPMKKEPALLLDLLRRWSEEVGRRVDTEVTIDDVLPRETAIEVPEERFAYLLTLIYRFLSRSPLLGDPKVLADGNGDGYVTVGEFTEFTVRETKDSIADYIAEYGGTGFVGDPGQTASGYISDRAKDAVLFGLYC